MCQTCQVAVTELRRKTGWSFQRAMDFLWSNTAFPVGDGPMILRQVRTFLRVKPKNRAKWFAQKDREMSRLMGEASDGRAARPAEGR